MGKALAYDFKILLPTLGILHLALAAACKYGGGQQAAQGGAPAVKLGG